MIEQLRRPGPPASKSAKNMEKYAIIGDVHSQLPPLQKAVDYCSSRGLTPILLGDLFDSRVESSDSAGVYRLVKDIESRMGAIVLQSNHHFKLEKFSRSKEVYMSEDFKRTLEDFSNANVPLQEVAEWLETFPYGVVFKDSRGVEYRCAHAMFPRNIMVTNYENLLKIDKVTSKSRGAMIYGPKVKGASWPEQEDRVFWWDRPTDREWIRVAGHYHVVHVSDKSLVLDGGMGGSCRESQGDPDTLCLWDVEARQLTQFT